MTPHTLIAQLTAATVAGLWQGAILALMAAAILRLMPRATASLRHTLLVAIFAIAAVLPWLHFGTAHTVSHTLSLAPWIAVAIAFIWLTLACIRATNLARAWSRLRTVSRQAIPVALEGIDSFSAGNRRAQLCTSADVDSPTILGFRRPRLLLPEWMAPLLTQADLQQIALHECEHLRRRDDWLNLLLQIGLVLAPLNPALIWLDRRIALQRELACDAAVVAATTQPIAYATCLTRLAEQRMHHTRLALAMAAWGKQSELVQRVHALLANTAAWTQRQSRLAACATAAALLAGTVTLARTPLLVQISAAPTTLVATTTSADQFTMSSGARMVPASFVLKPTRTATAVPHARRKPAPKSKPAFQTSQPQQPRFVRTAASDDVHPHTRTADLLTQRDDTTIRFVTTQYVAVPVANGWLIFQL